MQLENISGTLKLSPPQRLLMGNFRIMEGARGTMGRGKEREPLPNNVSKMALDF